jgi:hypothetical protein
VPHGRLQQRLDRLRALPPARRPWSLAWHRLSTAELEVLERLALRAETSPSRQAFLATLDADERARLDCIATKAALESTT